MRLPRRRPSAAPTDARGRSSIRRLFTRPIVASLSLALTLGLAFPPTIDTPRFSGLSADVAPDPVAAPTRTPTPPPTPPLTGGEAPPATQPPPAEPSPPPEPPRSREPEELTGYVWPLPRSRIHGWFAPRESGMVVIDGQRTHDGIDLATFCGDYVRAAHDGVVLHAGRRFDRFVGFSGPLDRFYARLEARRGLGDLPIVVVIDDGNGYHSMYVHLSKATVKAGQRVRAGEPIGREGATGRASGCHLHYGLVRMDGQWQAIAAEMVRISHYPPFVRERVDPMRVLSLDQPRAARVVPGIDPPEVSPGGPFPKPRAVPTDAAGRR